jgi:short chain dehydrogenase
MSKNDATTFLRVSQIASHIQRPQITDYPLPHVAATTPNDRLKGKVAILTGCNSHNGIGRATAMIFAAAGAKAVVLCDVSGTNLAKWAEEIGSMYPQTKVGWKQFDASG